MLVSHARIAMLWLTIPALGSGALAPTAHGDITYLAQARSITASAYTSGFPTSSQTLSAPDFGVFDNIVSAYALRGDARAYQTSTLAPLGINAIGGWYGHGFAVSPSGYGQGTSRFSVDFSIAEPVDFTLTTSGLSVLGSTFQFLSTNTSWLNLTQPPTSYQNTLSPGTYRLAGTVGGTGQTFGNGGEFSIILNIPSPAPTALVGISGLAMLRRRRR